MNEQKSLKQTIHAMKAGNRSVSEFVDRYLHRIEKDDKTIHSFVSVFKDEARRRAKELMEMSTEKRQSLPLFGLPIAIKDNICVKGFKTTCSSRMLENFIPPYSASVIHMLEKAGAIILGKTNLDEFAMGSSTETSALGITKNPCDIEYVPGGSSGGSVAAVAADLVPVSLGSDTGGSIRQPCSYCGVPGLKPTYGRVSRYGLVAFASSLDQIGPIAQDVRDLGQILSVISEPDKHDSTNAGKVFVDDESLYTGSVDGLKIGIPKEYFAEGISDSVRNAVENTIDSLKKRGAECVDVSLPSMQYSIAAYYILCTAEASSNLARYDGVKYGYRTSDPENLIDMYQKTRKEGFGDEVKRRIMLGTYVLSSGYYDAYYLKAARVRTIISNDFKKAFEKCDVIVSPVTARPAFKIGEKSSDPLEMYLTDLYTVSANLASIPAISVPCGTEGPLPIGVQFMAPKWREDLLLKTGFAVQVQ